MSDTLKSVVAQAKSEHKKVTNNTNTEFPAFIKVGFGSSVLTVGSNMQSFTVLVDKECHEWISGTLVEEVEQRINSDISSEEPEADQPSSKFTFAKAITGVRNKISWDNKHRTWKLAIQPQENVTNYLEREN